ncbi:MAG: histidine--tRNA ligase [Ruminococcaceae bacterium]|nr:histidine--tRNA ligase [Oscillospiraceae bacterium]
MDIVTKAPRGTEDKLPSQMNKWHTVEKIAAQVAEAYGCKEIRTPTFEHTELFQRGVGGTTDVVQKEMYTFNDKKGRSITLKPEGTAGAVRAALENGLLNEALPLKLYYFTRCFRYEAPQSGRLREFNQFGVEILGANSPVSDAEIICMVDDIFKFLNLKNVALEINSIGCPECRAKYQQALREYYKQYEAQLCDTCKERLEKNPMRLLDCKSEICHGFAKDAPVILDYLCDSCSDHFERVKKALDEMNVKYTVNPRIVRGLDYYTNTVFEFISDSCGAQGTVCGGGRYNGLVEEIGGKPVAALGFAMGLERILMVMDAQNADYEPAKRCDLFIAGTDENASSYALSLVRQLREYGFWAECDIVGRGLKAQMKYADKIGAAFSMVIGENEIQAGKAELKNMKTGEKMTVNIGDKFAENVNSVLMAVE